MRGAARRATGRLLAALGRRTHRSLLRRLEVQRREMDRLRLLVGQLHAERIRSLEPGAPLRDAEFRVFSQWGEDGIIEHIVQQVEIPNDVFVEFGVHDYRESNTRFLLQHRNWRGLVLDGGAANVASIRADEISWRYDLRAVQAFVTAENIDDHIRGAGFEGDIGLLSIDIDGMDYWVWKAIEAVDPRVVVCEYNSLFGAEEAVTVPYDPDFERGDAHHSHLYFGASLPALCDLAETKGYRLLGCTSAGNDAFFVREDCLNGLRPVSAAEGFVAGRARESRDPTGALTLLGRDEARSLIADEELEDVRTGRRLKVRDLDAG